MATKTTQYKNKKTKGSKYIIHPCLEKNAQQEEINKILIAAY
jgi:hypothetical protein